MLTGAEEMSQVTEMIQKSVFADPKIEKEARQLLLMLWENKELVWPDRQVLPLDIPDPAKACAYLGIEYLELPTLNNQPFMFKGRKMKTAGLIDRQANRIVISAEYQPSIMRFTAAHELGHWLLHPDEIMHRDRPISDGAASGYSRSHTERQADYFASCFLMPTKLVTEAFHARFLTTDQFVFDDATSFHLNQNDPDLLLRSEEGSLERELALASCKSYNNRYFSSLADTFKVSNTAMAIRLKELNLVKWP